MEEVHHRGNNFDNNIDNEREMESMSENNDSDDDAVEQEYYSRYKDKPPALASSILHIITAVSVGFLFGFIMEKGRGKPLININNNT